MICLGYSLLFKGNNSLLIFHLISRLKKKMLRKSCTCRNQSMDPLLASPKQIVS